MSLIPELLMAQLITNGSAPETDHVPVVLLFYPLSPATWLLSELNPYDKDTAYGLCDMGAGAPELGYVSLQEIESITSLGAAVIRDKDFIGRYPLSIYLEAARGRGAITIIPSLLEAAAERVRKRRNGSGH